MGYCRGKIQEVNVAVTIGGCLSKPTLILHIISSIFTLGLGDTGLPPAIASAYRKTISNAYLAYKPGRDSCTLPRLCAVAMFLLMFEALAERRA